MEEEIDQLPPPPEWMLTPAAAQPLLLQAASSPGGTCLQLLPPQLLPHAPGGLVCRRCSDQKFQLDDVTVKQTVHYFPKLLLNRIVPS